MARFLQFDDVSFAYPGMQDPLLAHVTAHFPEGGWTGIVGANGAGKTTLLKLAAGTLKPTEGAIRQIGTAQYAVQRTDAPPDAWDDFMNCWDAPAMDLRRLLGISDDWADRWDTLSHGERKRVQIAIALWHAPDVLALDEPTNHLDGATKRILLEALKRFRGAGLLVSHDREFLDALCSQCLFIFPPRIQMRPGGVSQGMEQDRREQTHAREQHDANAGKARRLAAAAQQRRLGISGHLRRQGAAAHIICQNGSGKHGRICPQKGVDRHHHWLQHRRQHRSQGHDAHHGQGQRTHGKDPVFKFLSQSPVISQNPVQGAQHGEPCHDGDEYFMK